MLSSVLRTNVTASSLFSIANRALFSTSVFSLKKAATTTKAKPVNKDAERKAKKTYPKRPLSAYSAFNRDFFERKKEELRGLSIAKTARIVSAEWEKLSPSEQKPFVDIANKDSVRYKQEREEAARNGPPKKPMNAYNRFFLEFRNAALAKDPLTSFEKIGAESGKAWNALPESEKEKYKQACQKAREDYDKALEQYNAKKNA